MAPGPSARQKRKPDAIGLAGTVVPFPVRHGLSTKHVDAAARL